MADMSDSDESIAAIASLETETTDDKGVPDRERQQIREKLSTMSFEELLKMKEELGSKVYNETVFGTEQKKLTNRSVKRINKNRPREISSKMKPKYYKTDNPVVMSVKKTIPRDPRFDPLCGSFDNESFTSNYKFINEIRQKEKSDLQKELEECKDVARQKKIKYLIQRIDNQLREKKKIDEDKHRQHEEKKEIRNQFKQGEEPVFKKKSVKKLEGLIEKYEQLKKSNKLQKHIEKRTKKLAQSDRKKMKFENM